MRILIDSQPDVFRDDYLRIAEALEQRRRGVVLRMLERNRSAVCWIVPDTFECSADPISTAVHRAAIAQSTEYFQSTECEGIAETLTPNPRLLVSGGGHVGQALARAAYLVGFEVVVVDDREEFSDPSLFGEGIQCRRGPFREALFEFPIDQDTYVALVGRGHIVDSKALLACLNSPAAYIGMMGSRRKVALVKKEFIDGMLIDEEGWKKIHAPIGLDIGAETVPEIAASIVAQLIEVRRRKAAPKME